MLTMRLYAEEKTGTIKLQYFACWLSSGAVGQVFRLLFALCDYRELDDVFLHSRGGVPLTGAPFSLAISAIYFSVQQLFRRYLGFCADGKSDCCLLLSFGILLMFWLIDWSMHGANGNQDFTIRVFYRAPEDFQRGSLTVAT